MKKNEQYSIAFEIGTDGKPKIIDRSVFDKIEDAVLKQTAMDYASHFMDATTTALNAAFDSVGVKGIPRAATAGQFTFICITTNYLIYLKEEQIKYGDNGLRDNAIALIKTAGNFGFGLVGSIAGAAAGSPAGPVGIYGGSIAGGAAGVLSFDKVKWFGEGADAKSISDKLGDITRNRLDTSKIKRIKETTAGDNRFVEKTILPTDTHGPSSFVFYKQNDNKDDQGIELNLDALKLSLVEGFRAIFEAQDKEYVAAMQNMDNFAATDSGPRREKKDDGEHGPKGPGGGDHNGGQKGRAAQVMDVAMVAVLIGLGRIKMEGQKGQGVGQVVVVIKQSLAIIIISIQIRFLKIIILYIKENRYLTLISQDLRPILSMSLAGYIMIAVRIVGILLIILLSIIRLKAIFRDQ